MENKSEIELQESAPLSEYQRYVYELEKMHGWLEVDLPRNCFLMGEEVGELFKAVRKYNKYYEEPARAASADEPARKAAVAEEIVDVFNYLIALANRLEIDVEAAFREKNARNQRRTWE